MEEFSVNELETFRRKSWEEDDEAIHDLVIGNLAISGDRDYNLEPNFSDNDTDYALAILVHDAVVNLYKLNAELNSEEFFDEISGKILDRVDDAEDLSEDIIWQEVHGESLNETVNQLADYYEENFEQASTVETEKVLNNNGFKGRADIVREIDGETEIRDIKTRYSDRKPVPAGDEKFKIACYALISREELNVDRFVLEYPLQGVEVEVEPEEWFAEIADTAEEYRQMLENARETEAEILEDEMGLNNGKEPREFVEGLNLGRMNWDYAEAAVTEGLK